MPTCRFPAFDLGPSPAEAAAARRCWRRLLIPAMTYSNAKRWQSCMRMVACWPDCCVAPSNETAGYSLRTRRIDETDRIIRFTLLRHVVLGCWCIACSYPCYLPAFDSVEQVARNELRSAFIWIMERETGTDAQRTWETINYELNNDAVVFVSYLKNRGRRREFRRSIWRGSVSMESSPFSFPFCRAELYLLNKFSV